jgi:serine/threonine-protein kinase
MISTIAGSYSDSGTAGDGGPAVNATLTNPSGLAVAADGTLYVADSSANTVRKISPNGTISRFAGIVGNSGSSSGSGDIGDGKPATQARLDGPEGVAVGPDGLVYIADTGNGLIRRVGKDGVLTRVAGTTRGYDDSDGPALETKLSNVTGIKLDGSGAIYLTEPYNQRVRRVSPDGATVTTVLTGSS